MLLPHAAHLLLKPLNLEQCSYLKNLKVVQSNQLSKNFIAFRELWFMATELSKFYLCTELALSEHHNTTDCLDRLQEVL